MEYKNGIDWIPEEEIINIFYNILSQSTNLQTIEIDSLTKTTTFYKNQDIGDLRELEVRYECPIICLKLGQRVDDDFNNNSDELIIKAFVIIDSSVSADTKEIAELNSKNFQRLIKNIIFFENKYQGNLRIISMKGFLVNPYRNGERYEVTWRNFIEIEYR